MRAKDRHKMVSYFFAVPYFVPKVQYLRLISIFNSYGSPYRRR